MDFRADDVEYQRQDGQPLLARLNQPIGPGPFPAVLEVHGGAWTGGDRFNNVAIAEALAADGVVVLSIDFRMPPVARYPDTIADVNASGIWPGKVVTEVAPAGPFWQAEPEHQDYLERYPNGYTCHYIRPNWSLPHRAA